MLNIPVKTILRVIIRSARLFIGAGLRNWKAWIISFCAPHRKENVRQAPGLEPNHPLSSARQPDVQENAPPFAADPTPGYYHQPDARISVARSLAVVPDHCYSQPRFTVVRTPRSKSLAKFSRADTRFILIASSGRAGSQSYAIIRNRDPAARFIYESFQSSIEVGTFVRFQAFVVRTGIQ
jgi:hypothetical protein